MALNPSDYLAAERNFGQTVFPNLSRRRDDTEAWPTVDAAVFAELRAARIDVFGPHESFRRNGEVPTAYIGTLCGWSFKRAWYYWIAEGPGVPADKAEEFHKVWGQQVRVHGHCGCPSPLEWCHGFGVGMYHVDTVEGLRALADLLRSIYVPGPDDEPKSPANKET